MKSSTSTDYAYIHHGFGKNSFQVQKVMAKNEYGDHWKVWYENRWRRIHITLGYTYIVHQGKRITTVIDGL